MDIGSTEPTSRREPSGGRDRRVLVSPRHPPTHQPTDLGTVRRRNDGLTMRVIGYGLRSSQRRNESPVLVRSRRVGEMHLVLEFPSQHVAEQGVEDSAAAGAIPSVGALDARIAPPTRLAFVIKDADLPIELSIDSLLDWNRWEPSLVPVPIPPPQHDQPPPVVREPWPWETAIEAPWALVLSPDGGSIWRHASVPHVANGRTTLWHTRLRSAGAEGPATVRAAWARPVPGGNTPAMRILPVPSLTPDDRDDIVSSSAIRTIENLTPRPITADELMLTPLGATLDLTGRWEQVEGGSSLASWVHRSTGGRDHYVRVVRRGFYVPWGHDAAVVEISERRPATSGSAFDLAAYVFKQRFWTTLRPVMDYPTTLQPFQGRDLPFRSVQILTSRTPKLDQGHAADEPHQALVAGKEFLFDLVGIDHADRSVPFRAPLVFVPADAKKGVYGSGLAGATKLYGTPKIQVGGQQVAFADEDNATAGTTSLTTDRLTVAAVPTTETLAGLQADGIPPFWPRLVNAEIRLDPATVASGASTGPLTARYWQGYVNIGFSGGEVFLHAAQGAPPVPLTFPTAGRGGGVVRPDLRLDGVSRSLGVVAEAAGVATGTPSKQVLVQMLGDVTLLGIVPLAELIDVAGLDQVPRLRTDVTKGTAQHPEHVETSMRWKPKLADSTTGPFDVRADTAVLHVDSVWCRDLVDDTSTSTVRGEIRTLGITAAKSIEIELDRIAFTSIDGGKTDVRVALGNVGFIGVLDFLAELTRLMPTPAAPQGPYVDVSSSMIRTGLVVELPAVQIGAFTLENIRFRSELDLALDGKDAVVRFAFSNREDPFHLIVLALGGGGSMQIEVDRTGLRSIEASLEAGAQIGVDLGVATGKVSAFVGVYFRLADESATIEAYIRIAGSLRLLGLVTVSAKLLLTLKYHDGSGKLSGTASCCYSIDMGLWEKDICVSVQRTIAGSGSDPFFDEEMTPAQWTDYCEAFAS